ncbi:carbamate kinase [Oxalobacteraceae bacterium GrIS 1.11]
MSTIVVALGGNALLKRGAPMTPDEQRRSVRLASAQLAIAAAGHSLAIVHGNGPQVGLLALHNEALPAAERFPLDQLGAQTEGMIGYVLEQELRNALPGRRSVASLLSMTEVAADDPAFAHPDKPVGAMYNAQEAAVATREHGWTMAADGAAYRRVVPSPWPLRLLEIDAVQCLLAHGSVVICAGGGGIPVLVDADGRLRGVEAVIDKDRSAALLARAIQADQLLIATDVAGIMLDWGTPAARLIRRAHPDALDALTFAAGSMAPKVAAACEFARRTGREAVIGALGDIADMLAGRAGTVISCAQAGMVTACAAPQGIA